MSVATQFLVYGTLILDVNVWSSAQPVLCTPALIGVLVRRRGVIKQGYHCLCPQGYGEIGEGVGH